MYLCTPKQMKEIEANADSAGITYSQMMDSAGMALAEAVTEYCVGIDYEKGAVILCGSGNNGGDGFITAKLLSDMGLKVTVVLMCGEPSTELAGEKYIALSGTSCEVLTLNDNIDKVFKLLAECGLLIDAVFGTGFHDDLPPAIKACFSYSARTDAVKVAVDVPSGGNALTGTVSENTLKCDYTVTFGCKKIGMASAPLIEYCGEILVCEIGIPDIAMENVKYLPKILDEKTCIDIVPERKRDSHKGNFGRLMNIAGSDSMRGAAALSTCGALRSGAGLVTLASVESVINAVSANVYETMYMKINADKNGFMDAEKSYDELKERLAKCSSVSIGCGMGVTEKTTKLVKFVIDSTSCPVILDADGINCAANSIDMLKNIGNRLICTPHPAELARLLGVSLDEVLADRFSAAVKLSSLYDIIIVSKGCPTYIAGCGRAYVSFGGNPGLSRGGSGDLLTGIIAGLAAQGISPAEAAAAGVYIHGRSADITAEELSEYGMLPTDVLSRIPLVFKEMNR